RPNRRETRASRGPARAPSSVRWIASPPPRRAIFLDFRRQHPHMRRIAAERAARPPSPTALDDIPARAGAGWAPRAPQQRTPRGLAAERAPRPPSPTGRDDTPARAGGRWAHPAMKEPSMSITPARKEELIKEYATKEGDTGSPEVQVAILTERISNLTEHFKD